MNECYAVIFWGVIGVLVLLWISDSQKKQKQGGFSLKKLPLIDRISIIETLLMISDQGISLLLQAFDNRTADLEKKVKELERKLSLLEEGEVSPVVSTGPVSPELDNVKVPAVTDIQVKVPELEAIRAEAQGSETSGIPQLGEQGDIAVVSEDNREAVPTGLKSAAVVTEATESTAEFREKGMERDEVILASSGDYPGSVETEEKTHGEKPGKTSFNWEKTLLKAFTVIGTLLISVGTITVFQRVMKPDGIGNIGGFNPLQLLVLVFGTVLGLGLTAIGDYYQRRRAHTLGQALLSCGFCTLIFTVVAGHFYFHLIPLPVASVVLLGIVLASGFTIFRYDSKIIANVVLFGAFITPFLMSVKLNQPVLLYSYLISINLAVIAVAYFKKWDYYIMISFLFSYVHYFLHVRISFANSTIALVFLTVFYLMFLVSNNLFHFKKKVSGGYSLFVSYFNPLLYAVLSYSLLSGSTNWASLGIYAGLGIIHLYLTKGYKALEEFDPGFEAVTRNNLVLGLLFITSATSFITYFAIDSTYFSLVTGLWFVQAFVLLWYSFRSGFAERIIRRFSYLTLIIIWVQMVLVVSWMPEEGAAPFAYKYAIYLVSIILFYAYFHYMYKNRHHLEEEDRKVMNGVLVSCLALFIYSIYRFTTVFSLLFIAGAAASILLYISLIFRDKLANLRYGAYLLAGITAFGVLATEIYSFRGTVPGSEGRFPCYVLLAIAYLFMMHSLHRFRENLGSESTYAFNTGTAIVTALTVIILHHLLVPFAIPALMVFLGICLLYGYYRYPETLKFFKKIGKFLFSKALIFLPLLEVAAFFADPPGENIRGLLFLLAGSLFLVNFHLLKKYPDIGDEKYKTTIFNISLLGSMLSLLFSVWWSGVSVIIFIVALFSYLLMEISARIPQYTEWIRREKLPMIMCGIVTLISLFLPSPGVSTSFDVFRLLLPIGSVFLFLSSWHIVTRNKDLFFDPESKLSSFYLGCVSLLLGKTVFIEIDRFGGYEILTTCLWSCIILLTASVGLPRTGRKLFPLLVFLATAVFLKAGLDSSQMIVHPNISTGKIIFDSLLVLLTTLIFHMISGKTTEDTRIYNLFKAFTLLIFPFLTSAVLFQLYGLLMEFQMILTVFWSLSAFLYVLIGIRTVNSSTRLFGMFLMLAIAAKIVLVDIHELRYFSMLPLFFIDGILFLITPMIYHKYQEQLEEKTGQEYISPEDDEVSFMNDSLEAADTGTV